MIINSTIQTVASAYARTGAVKQNRPGASDKAEARDEIQLSSQAQNFSAKLNMMSVQIRLPIMRTLLLLVHIMSAARTLLISLLHLDSDWLIQGDEHYVAKAGQQSGDYN